MWPHSTRREPPPVVSSEIVGDLHFENEYPTAETVAKLSDQLDFQRGCQAFLRNIAGEGAAFTPFAAEPSMLAALYGLIAGEIVKWVVLGESAPIHDHALAMNIASAKGLQDVVKSNLGPKGTLKM